MATLWFFVFIVFVTAQYADDVDEEVIHYFDMTPTHFAWRYFSFLPPLFFDPHETVITAGKFQTCVLNRQDHVIGGGLLRCWTNNHLILEPPPQYRHKFYKQVSSQQSYVCGLDLDGRVDCWDSLHNKNKLKPPIVTTPKQNLLQICTGGRFGCGLTVQNRVLCWGKINNVKDVPEDFFYQVSCGNDHVCGLLADNSIKCWGSDSHFEYIPAHEMYSQISGSYYHFCAIERETMFVKCWGPNFFNECNAPSMVQFRQVVTGKHLSCGITQNFDILCWGEISALQDYSYAQTRKTSEGLVLIHKENTVPIFLSVGDYQVCAVCAPQEGDTIKFESPSELMCWSTKKTNVGYPKDIKVATAPR